MSDEGRIHRPDWLGGLVGILTFLGGIGLLLLTFNLAYHMFSVPPSQALGVRQDAPVDFAKTGESFVGVVGRVLLLLVMSAVGSVIANRGIKLYGESRAHPHPKPTRRDEPASHPLEATPEVRKAG